MMSSSVTRTPVSDISPTIVERSANLPSLEPYCSAEAPSCFIASRTARSTSSCGTRRTSGIPPESEMTSGRDAAANRSRTADERTPAIAVAYRPSQRSKITRALPIALTLPSSASDRSGRSP